ncbi:MAG: LON peptidase substrate-binding domain-containing protein, partial [Pseudomonadota bacterium]|nr:LON peptidase substrate-binding domain-containing protein [Pseudomonadota bacterium]
MFSKSTADIYPILPLRDIVVFPHMIVPLFVGREKSVRALEEVMKTDKKILLVAQRDPDKDDPTPEDLYDVGSIGQLLQLLKLPDGTVKVLVEGTRRARIERFEDSEDFLQAEAVPVEEHIGDPQEVEGLSRSAISQFEQYMRLNKKIPPEIFASLSQIEDPGRLADTLAAHLTLKITDKQNLLELVEVAARLEKIFGFMDSEIGVLQVERRIRSRVKKQMEKTQREYYLNEQMKAIQKELGEDEDGRDEIDELEEKIKKTRLTKEAREKCKAELRKLKAMSPMSAETSVVRNYLDWML